jgi:hypothetical protein
MPVLTDDPQMTLYLARGEKLAKASSLVGDQDDFHAWRSQRNEWIAAVSSRLTNDGMAYEAEAFRRAALVRQPFSRWQLALDAEVDAVCAAVDDLRRLLSHDRV